LGLSTISSLSTYEQPMRQENKLVWEFDEENFTEVQHPFLTQSVKNS